MSMLHTMGKFLNMGMPLEEVVARSTYIPAKVINRPDPDIIGQLWILQSFLRFSGILTILTMVTK